MRKGSGRWAPVRRRRLPCLLALLALGTSAPVLADESVPIEEVLADPDAYHLRVITLHGTVREVTPIEPYRLPSGTGCYGAYSFVLGDPTGAVEVTVLGVCGTPILKAPDVLAGDDVVVEAEIHAPGHTGRFYGPDRRPLPGQDVKTVQVVARSITPAVQPAPPEPP